MEKELLIIRLKELKAQLSENSKKLEDLDKLLANGETDEAVAKYAEGLRQIIDEREPILNEARGLLLEVYKNAPDIDDGGAWVN